MTPRSAVVGSIIFFVLAPVVSWPHHQLWLVFAAFWYLVLGGRTATLLGVALFAIFLGYPWFDDYPAGTIGTLLGIGTPC